MSDKETKEELLTAKEVAALLRLAASTVFGAAARGDLPCVRLWRGRRKSVVRFRRSEVEELMRRGSPLPRLKG